MTGQSIERGWGHEWLELPSEKAKALYAGPWRSWEFGLNGRFTRGTEWVPTSSSPTSEFREEGVETLLLMNLDRVFAGWQMRLGARELNGWAGADIIASDPNGTAHVFEVKYGAPEENIVDQALSYAVKLLSDRRPAWFDEQAPATQEVFICSRVAGLLLNERSDKWSRAQDRPYLEGYRKVLADKMAAERGGLETLQGGVAQAIREMLPAEERKRIDEGLETTDLHLHLVVPSPQKIKASQLDALARLKFRGLRVSIWQFACQRSSEPERRHEGRFAIREVWLRPQDTKAGGQRGDNIGPSVHLAPLLNSATVCLGFRLPFQWRYSRDNSATVGDDWFRHRFPALSIRETHEGASRVLRVRIGLVIPERWGGMPQAARALDARQGFVSEWLLKCAPPGEEDACLQALVMRRRRKLVWRVEVIDGLPNRVTISASRSSGLVTGEVSWNHEDLDLSASVLSVLLRHALEVAHDTPEAFPNEYEL